MLEDETSSTSDNTNNNKSTTANGQSHPKNNVTADRSVDVLNASATWSPKLEKDNLSNITLRVPEGKLCAVIGPVGSGKVRIRLLYYSKQGHWWRVGASLGEKKILRPPPAREDRLKDLYNNQMKLTHNL